MLIVFNWLLFSPAKYPSFFSCGCWQAQIDNIMAIKQLLHAMQYTKVAAHQLQACIIYSASYRIAL